MLPIVEKAQAKLAGRDLAGVFDDTVVARFELIPAEVKALAGLVLADGVVLDALPLTGMRSGAFQMALDNLSARSLITVEKGRADLGPIERQMKVETEDEAELMGDFPVPVIVLRSVPETAYMLSRSTNNPAVALGRVYAFVFGQRARNFPVLGRIARELGIRRATQFFLEHMLDAFQGDPLSELLPQALWLAAAIRNGGVRPENAPDEEEQRAEAAAADRESWLTRMRQWLEYNTEKGALAYIDRKQASGAYGEIQAEMLRRQIKLDFERYKREGEPNL